MVCFFVLQEEPRQKEVLTSLLWLVPTRSLPGAHIPPACNSTPVPLAANRAPSDGRAPSCPYPLSSLAPFKRRRSNPDKPEPENIVLPRIPVWGQEKINQNSNSQGGLGTSTSFHFYLQILIKKKDVEVIATIKASSFLFSRARHVVWMALCHTMKMPAPPAPPTISIRHSQAESLVTK